MSDISYSHVCYICRTYLHVEGDILLADTIIIRGAKLERTLAVVHPWCKRALFEKYEQNMADPYVKGPTR